MHSLNCSLDIVLHSCLSEERERPMRRVTLITFFVSLALIRCFPQDTAVTTGSIHGDVFTKGQGGERSVLPGTRVVLKGPASQATQSDARGAYAFDSVPPGKYSVEASAPGLSATQEVEVKAGGTSV